MARMLVLLNSAHKNDPFTPNLALRPIIIGKAAKSEAPTRIPNRLAALITPCCVFVISNSSAISGIATPVMNTTRPSKNLPAAASVQMRHCIAVIGVDWSAVPSAQIGVSSI